MRRKGKYLRYYVKPVRDDRNGLARSIDFYGPLLLVMFATLMAVLAYAGVCAKALVLAAPILALEACFAFWLRKLLRQNAAAHHRAWEAGRICRERIINIGGVEKLTDIVVKILERLDGFSNVQAVNNIPEKNAAGEAGAARALYRGVPVAVGCLLPKEGEGAVSAGRVLEFKEEIKRMGMGEGILVAAGVFSGEAGRAAREGGNRVFLVDLHRLVDLARQTGHEIFPPAPGGRDPVSAGGKQRNRRFFWNALSREKARGYFFCAVLLLSIQHLSGAEMVLKQGYQTFGLINLTLSLYCILSNREGGLPGTAGKRNNPRQP